MTESFTETLRQGYRNWRENLILAAPVILNMIACIILFLAGVFIAAFAGVMAAIAANGGIITLVTIIGLALIFGLIILLVNSFFVAGGVGMSMKAVNGKTSLNDMIEYGRKKAPSMFLATLATLLIGLAALVLFIPSALAFYIGYLGPGIGLLVLGGIAYIVCYVLLVVVYTLAQPAIVVKDLSGIEGLREAYRFFTKNKAKVLVFYASYFFIIQLSWLVFGLLIGPFKYLGMISEVLYGLLMLFFVFIYILIMTLTISPLYYVWLTRMYMTEVTGIKKRHAKKPEQPKTQERPSQQPELYVEAPQTEVSSPSETSEGSLRI